MKSLNQYINEAKKITMDDLDASPDNLVSLWKELGIDADKLKSLIKDENWEEIAKTIAKTINDNEQK